MIDRFSSVLVLAFVTLGFVPAWGQLHDPYCIENRTYAAGACEPGGYVPRCDATSFTRPRIPPASTAPFTMIIASDTQLPWGTDPSCTGTTEECEIAYGTQTNTWFVQSMNDIESLGSWPAVVPNSGGNPVAHPQGVIINGDLTAFFHPWQLDLYRQFYDPGYSGAVADVLQLPLYAGLGNHDYANNVNDCFGDEVSDWTISGANSCAMHAARYVKAMVGCGSVPNFPHASIHSFDPASLAYSWDFHGWHFVQLNNYPTYQVPAISVSSAIPWLANDLAQAAAAEKRVVLNLHDYAEHWSMTDPGFQAAIAGKTVVAVFAGHFHGIDGLTDTVPGTSIPIFLSGAAEKKRFLVAEFGSNYLSVATINTTNGTPSFVTLTRSADLDSYAIAAPPVVDADGDGVSGGSDNCPLIANADQLESDGDGIGDLCDNCALAANPDQQNSDADAAGDLCDNCPTADNSDQLDSDGDGIGDACDNCPLDANATQQDSDGDGAGDSCDASPYCSTLPRSACDDTVRAKLTLVDNPNDDKDQLKLTLTGATALEQSAFGNPTASARTSVCLYYDDTLMASYVVAADAVRWRNSGRGWGYRDSAGTQSGITKLKEVAGRTGTPRTPKITVGGRGGGLPELIVPVPGGVAAVRVQVHNSDTSTCFDADFAPTFAVNAMKNGAGTFRASQP